MTQSFCFFLQINPQSGRVRLPRAVTMLSPFPRRWPPTKLGARGHADTPNVTGSVCVVLGTVRFISLYERSSG